MTYIDLVNDFWQKDIEFCFSDKATAFYFYLLKTCNSIGWKNPFGLSNDMTIARFKWGKTSFDTAKNDLKKAGLIDFKSGNGRGCVYQYEIKGIKKGVPKRTLSNTLSDTLSNTLSDQKPATSIDIDIDKEKENNSATNVASSPVIEPVKIDPLEASYSEIKKTISFSSDLVTLNKEIGLISKFITEQHPIFHQPYIDLWNLFAKKYKKPSLMAMSKKRKSHLAARLADKNFKFVEILGKASKSDFCMDGTWFSFDWLTESTDNYLKVLEGKYDKVLPVKSNGSGTDKPVTDVRVEQQKLLDEQKLNG